MLAAVTTQATNTVPNAGMTLFRIRIMSTTLWQDTCIILAATTAITTANSCWPEPRTPGKSSATVGNNYNSEAVVNHGDGFVLLGGASR
jgi:hypothetical protein